MPIEGLTEIGGKDVRSMICKKKTMII